MMGVLRAMSHEDFVSLLGHRVLGGFCPPTPTSACNEQLRVRRVGVGSSLRAW